jgi:hypothetical protein
VEAFCTASVATNCSPGVTSLKCSSLGVTRSAPEVASRHTDSARGAVLKRCCCCCDDAASCNWLSAPMPPCLSLSRLRNQGFHKISEPLHVVLQSQRLFCCATNMHSIMTLLWAVVVALLFSALPCSCLTAPTSMSADRVSRSAISQAKQQASCIGASLLAAACLLHTQAAFADELGMFKTEEVM